MPTFNKRCIYTTRPYTVEDAALLKQKIPGWASAFGIFCFLDNNHYRVEPSRFDCILAAGVRDSIAANNIDGIDGFINRYSDCWKFGHLSYDLRTSLYPRLTRQDDKIGFSPLFFFVPQILLILKGSILTITAPEPDAIYHQLSIFTLPAHTYTTPYITLQERLNKEAYLQKIAQLQAHIRRGDCYEINFCQELFSKGRAVDPAAVFTQLNKISPTPFTAFYRNNDSYLLCASPERFLQKKRNELSSQPIKGTIKRDLQDNKEDEALKKALLHSAKDRAENVMIVDLVRNDLAKVCKAGTIDWTRLYEIHTYPQVHQLISTITGELQPDTAFSDIIKALFPAGSMTGAPKRRVLQLIDEYEPSARGIFSGSVGYITPEGDFDFNVIIRSIMYNAATAYLSCLVGGGITTYSQAEAEWEECGLKARAIKMVLAGD